jgi:hypothetical protein
VAVLYSIVDDDISLVGDSVLLLEVVELPSRGVGKLMQATKYFEEQKRKLVKSGMF